jgi:hypothetical protein
MLGTLFGVSLFVTALAAMIFVIRCVICREEAHQKGLLDILRRDV